MLTSCPACATHFRVTPEQLKVRSGRVRCGACQNVFNALDSLIEEPLLVAPPTPEATPPSVSDMPHAAEVVATAELEFDSEPIAVAPAPTIEPVAPAPDEPTPEEPASVHAEPEAADQAAPDWDVTFPVPSPPPRRWPWLIGGLLAFAVLGLQAVLAFRVQLAVLWPQARPALVALCEIAGCEVGLPAKVGLVGIEASDLHPDGAAKGRLALVATLKNRAPFAQQFPHLELTLTDTADKAIARKVLAPADYLPAATAPAQGMPPNADIAVAVGIDSGELGASGYRLYLFYP